jgi:hypothetical protein
MFLSALQRLVNRAAPAIEPYVAPSIEPDAAQHSDGATTEAEERSREKARLKEILTCQEASGRETLAQTLALSTDLSATDARAILAGYPIEVADDPKDRPGKPTAKDLNASHSADFFARHKRDNPEAWAEHQEPQNVAARVAQIAKNYEAVSGLGATRE